MTDPKRKEYDIETNCFNCGEPWEDCFCHLEEKEDEYDPEDSEQFSAPIHQEFVPFRAQSVDGYFQSNFRVGVLAGV